MFFIPPLIEWGLYCNHLVCPSICPSVRSHFRNRYLSFYWKKWFYIWYMALAWWLVPCLPFPGLPQINFLFTVRLRIFHVCRNENFRNSYLSFYWKKWFYIWYMALAWWLVPCLPFPGLPHIYFLFTVRLRIFHFAVMKTFVTVISASTGRNDFIFDIWLWHGDLYRVSPFQVYRTSTSCLLCDLQMNEWGYS
jgi:hypothetical protein